MKLLIHVLVSGLAVFITANMLRGVTVSGYGSSLAVAVVLGIVSAVLGPILILLTLPINIMTLGLFTFVIIGVLVQVVAFLVPGFQVANFWWGLVFALVLSIVNALLHAALGRTWP